MKNTDLIKIAKQLDKIITSERPEVKEAFRELLIVSALIESNEEKGPFTTLYDKVDRLETDLRRLSDRVSMNERENAYRGPGTGYDEAMRRGRLWGGGTVPDDQLNPFKRLYETTYINNPYSKDDDK